MAREEPTENLSGSTPHADETAFTVGEAETRAEAVVDHLGERYWRKRYGDQPAFACLVRTILSQNTSDKASQPAFDAVVDKYGDRADLAVAISAADQDHLAETISPAGLHNQKSRVLIKSAQTVLDRWGSAEAFDAFVADEEPATVRDALLSFDGVGPKTADCVLLFAGGRNGVFPVDTHVHRIARRIGIAPPDADHETVRHQLEEAIPAEKCGFGHTSMIQFGREYCTATAPACLDGETACPLSDMCERVGVDATTGTVVDPAELT